MPHSCFIESLIKGKMRFAELCGFGFPLKFEPAKVQNAKGVFDKCGRGQIGFVYVVDPRLIQNKMDQCLCL